MSAHHHAHHRHGGIDPAHVQRLDDPARFRYLPIEAVVAFVEAPPNALVVDLGAGTGTYALAFAQARPDCRVVAVDIEPEMLARLRAKPNAATVRAGGPELLRELSGSIDRVFGINVLHHLSEEDLRGLCGALAPDGAVAFIDWNPEVERPSGPPNDRLYSPAEAERLLTGHGLRIERRQTLPYHYALFCRPQP
jgi:SAM-dependent methyltransferase